MLQNHQLQQVVAAARSPIRSGLRWLLAVCVAGSLAESQSCSALKSGGSVPDWVMIHGSRVSFESG